jgi:tetratricopeptide (TPR) repeat protein
MDKYKYLLARKNWPKLGESVLKSLSDSFDKADDTLFLEFVELSERNNMLKRNYLELQEDTIETEELIWLIAVTLERKGAQYCQKYAESDDVSLLDKAISLYRSSFTLNENFIPGYFQLSIALAAKGQVEESKKSFELGKKIYRKLSDSTTDLNSFENAMLHQLSPDAIESFEKGLASILSTYDSGAL